MFVYLITNTINGKRYVGQTRQTLAKRWIAHCSKNRCRYLYNAIQKYGRQSFIIEPIVEVSTRELANEFEIEYIERYKTHEPNGYNICTGGDNRAHSWLGKKHSEESKLKMSLAKCGKSSPRLGAVTSDESKLKMRLAKLGKPSPRKGVHLLDETLGKLRAAWQIRRLREIPLATRLKMKQSQQARRLREHGGRVS